MIAAGKGPLALYDTSRASGWLAAAVAVLLAAAAMERMMNKQTRM